MSGQPKPAKSQTLLRGLDILEAVARGPLSIPEIASATGTTYPTAHRMVGSLIERRYLRALDNRCYGLGPKVIELGFLAYQQGDLTKIARPYLEDLAAATSDTVHLARLEGGEVVYLDKLPSRRPIEISSRIGGRKSAITTGVGKAMLLDRSDAALDDFHRRYRDLDGCRSDARDWLDRMRAYRAAGCAYDLGEAQNQIRCVAAPLRDGSGQIVAAVSVSSTADYMSRDRMEELVGTVTATASRISAELGYAGDR